MQQVPNSPNKLLTHWILWYEVNPHMGNGGDKPVNPPKDIVCKKFGLKNLPKTYMMVVSK